jgi:hypothetical protein
MYPIMPSKGFISEIRDYKRISLGYREEQFLDIIATGQWGKTGAEFYYSAYDIYRELNAGEGHKGKARKLMPNEIYSVRGDDSISYKDVHKRVKRLETLGLIEPVDTKIDKQKQKRNVIKYTVTSRGLFQCCLYFQWAARRPAEIPLMLLYKDNVIFQTLLYQYFKENTIREILSIFVYDIFHPYLRKCCEGTLTINDEVRFLQEQQGSEDSESLKEERLHYQLEDIDRIIQNELKNLIYEIVRESSKDIYRDKFPSRILRDDKQLLESVDDLNIQFSEGVKTLFYC